MPYEYIFVFTHTHMHTISTGQGGGWLSSQKGKEASRGHWHRGGGGTKGAPVASEQKVNLNLEEQEVLILLKESFEVQQFLF